MKIVDEFSEQQNVIGFFVMLQIELHDRWFFFLLSTFETTYTRVYIKPYTTFRHIDDKT